MVKSKSKRTRERALLALLDDSTPLVQEALLEEFRRLGLRGQEILRSVLREGSEDSARSARRLLAEIEENEQFVQFVEFIRGMHYELETGLLLINRVLSPQFSVVPVRAELDRLAQRCLELRVMPMTPRQECSILNRVFFHEAGFRGALEPVGNPLNSCLEGVCQRRKGFPLILSAIYVLVGQRIGLELEPVALPGTFMVGCFQGSNPFYIDPFAAGRFHDAEDLWEHLRKKYVQPEFCHLAPIPVGDVLRASCLDLAQQFDAQKNVPMSHCFHGFVREFEATYRRVRKA